MSEAAAAARTPCARSPAQILDRPASGARRRRAFQSMLKLDAEPGRFRDRDTGLRRSPVAASPPSSRASALYLDYTATSGHLPVSWAVGRLPCRARQGRLHALLRFPRSRARPCAGDAARPLPAPSRSHLKRRCPYRLERICCLRHYRLRSRLSSTVSVAMAELLLELFSEEIPARMQTRAREDLARCSRTRWQARGSNTKTLKTFATPRRLVAGGRRPAGPLARCARGEEGPARRCARSRRSQGFLKSAGLASIDAGRGRETRRATSTSRRSRSRAGRPRRVVAEIVPEIIAKFPLAEIDALGRGKLSRWVRPLHSILCPARRQGGAVRGRRHQQRQGDARPSLLGAEALRLKGFADYARKLRDAKVVLDGDERAEHHPRRRRAASPTSRS